MGKALVGCLIPLSYICDKDDTIGGFPIPEDSILSSPTTKQLIMIYLYLYRRNLSLFLFIAMLTFIAVPKAASQTCRINCGINQSGHQSYKEVYEYDFVSEKPAFPGGGTSLLEFLNHNRQYPEEAYRKGIQGRVTCQFVVNADGSVTDIHLIRGVEPSLNREAIRLFSIMPDWKPGRHNGKPVPVRVIWSVPFRR